MNRPHSEELPDIQYEILRCAVNLARDRQIQSVSILRNMLNQRFANQAEDVDSALRFWANNAQARSQVMRVDEETEKLRVRRGRHGLTSTAVA